MLCKIYNYNSFDLSSLNAESLEVIIWGMCAGIIVGVLCSIIQRTYTSALIRVLVKKEINEESKAKTLTELGVSGKWYLRRALNSSHKPLRRCVMCANERALPYTEMKSEETEVISIKGKSMNEARFYLPEEHRIKAETRFTPIKRPIFSMIFTSVLIIAAALFAIYVAPELIQMLENFISTLEN